MPEEKTDRPKVMLEAVAEEPAVTRVEELAKVEETPVVSMPIEVTRVENGGKWTWVWAVVGLLLGMAVGGGGGYVAWGMKKGDVAARPTPTKTVNKIVPTPTVEMKVEIKRSELVVQVLNGSGVRGEAAKAKDFLEGLGYKDVATGNADRDDYEGTSVAVKKGKKAVWETVKADVGSKYEVSEEMGELPDSSEYDAVVTLGGV